MTHTWPRRLPGRASSLESLLESKTESVVEDQTTNTFESIHSIVGSERVPECHQVRDRLLAKTELKIRKAY